MWDEKVIDDKSGVSDDDAFWEEIRKHTKSNITTSELKKRMDEPEKYDVSNLDSIEVVE